ncbi:MAG: hypothetical protein [Microvirus sp.]|nr:MAG: hypothetical protein [Microvirus sp.]
MIKTYLNRDSHSRNYEINDEASETIPDQTMSIREILDRYTRGQVVDGVKTSIFQEDYEYNDLPDPRTLDLSERQDLANQLRSELEDIKNKYPKKTSGAQGDEIPATLPEKGADGTEAQKTGNEIA